jgi:hypothetical protein
MRQSSEEERLNRQVRGLLNRLTQSNLHSVGTQLLTIYDDNSDIRALLLVSTTPHTRHDVSLFSS